jgi:MFS family permease
MARRSDPGEIGGRRSEPTRSSPPSGKPRPGGRLLLLVSGIVLVDTVFFAALTPLLPYYADEFGLSTSAVGALSAAYAAGAIAGAIPGGLLAVRFGPKPTVLIGLLITVATSVVFGFAETPSVLYAARVGQGIGSALSWTGALTWLVIATARDRRGAVIGVAMGAAVAGALLGPVLGGSAALFSPSVAFASVAVVGVILAGWAWKTSAPSKSEPPRFWSSLRNLTKGDAIVGYIFVCLAAFLFGVISVVGPLRLDELGWGPVIISAVFFVSAGVEAALNPALGRWSDQSGPLRPIRVGLVFSTGTSIGLATIDGRWVTLVLVAAAGIAYGIFWVPGTALFSNGAESAGVEQGVVFASLNLAWAPANVVGAAVGGALAETTARAYLVIACACLAMLATDRLVLLGTPRPGARDTGHDSP